MDGQHAYYLGSAETKLNSKGQAALPARIRSVVPDEELARNFVLLQGAGQCVYMYTHSQFAIVKDRAKEQARQMNNSGFFRRFMAGAFSVDIDSQGRFVLPPALMAVAGILGPTLKFIGVDDRIEIWEPSVYEQSMSGAEDYDAARKRVAEEIFGM